MRTPTSVKIEFRLSNNEEFKKQINGVQWGELEGIFVEVSVVLLAKWVDLNHYLVQAVSWCSDP